MNVRAQSLQHTRECHEVSSRRRPSANWETLGNPDADKLILLITELRLKEECYMF